MRDGKGGGPRKPSGRRKLFPGEEWLVRRDGSPAWHFDFQIDGARFRGSCGTGELEAAAAFAASRRDAEWRRLKLGEAPPPAAMTLNDACVRFYREVAKGTSYGERGRKHQMARMVRLLGADTPLTALNDTMVNDLVQLLRTTPLAEEGKRAGQVASPATVNRYLDTLSAICKRAREIWGVAVGEWTRTAHKMKEPPPKARYLEHEDARRVLHEAVPHVVPLMALDLMTGMRKANVVGLQWEQVSLDLGRAVVVGKGGKVLGIPLPPDAVRLLARLEPDETKRAGPVFRYGNPNVPCPCPACSRPLMKLVGKPFKNPKRSIRSAFARAGLAGTRFHDLRHTFASWLLTEGGDLKLVQQALGHSQIETTLRYAHLVAGRRESVTERATAGLLDAPRAALPTPEKKGKVA